MSTYLICAKDQNARILVDNTHDSGLQEGQSLVGGSKKVTKLQERKRFTSRKERGALREQRASTPMESRGQGSRWEGMNMQRPQD